MFGWLRTRRRKKILAGDPSAEERFWVSETCWQLHYLPSSLQRTLINKSRVIAKEKHFEGCKGLVLTNQIRIAIASQIALMLLAFDDEYLDSVQTILVYPDSYVVEEALFNTGSNLTVVGPQAREGQTQKGGPVIVNWNSISGQVLSDGSQRQPPYDRPDAYRNLVVHEFAHQVDMVDGWNANGIPPLASHLSQTWADQFKDCFEFERQNYHERFGFRIDGYGLTSLVEYFAVTSESYFQSPNALADNYAKTYQLLDEFYGLDLRAHLPI